MKPAHAAVAPTVSADSARILATSGARLGGERLFVYALLLVVSLLLLPPLGILFYGALTDTPPAVSPNFTLHTLYRAYGQWRIYPALINSVIFAAATATLVLLVGGFLAWVVVRTESAVRHLTDLLVLAPILMPAVLLVSGWILLLSPRSGMINMAAVQYFAASAPLFDIYSFSGMVWVAMLQELPLAFLWLWPAFRSMNPELEEAGLACGASRLRTIMAVVAPLLVPSIIASFVYVTLRSFREYTASIFLTAPGTEVFAVLVLDMWDGGNPNILCAYVTMVIGLIAVALMLFYAIGRRLGWRL